MTHTEWLPGVRLSNFSTTCAVCIEDCVVVVAQWQSTGCTSWCPGLDSWQLPAFSLFTFLYFRLKYVHLISLYSNVRHEF